MSKKEVVILVPEGRIGKELLHKTSQLLGEVPWIASQIMVTEIKNVLEAMRANGLIDEADDVVRLEERPKQEDIIVLVVEGDKARHFKIFTEAPEHLSYLNNKDYLN